MLCLVRKKMSVYVVSCAIKRGVCVLSALLHHLLSPLVRRNAVAAVCPSKCERNLSVNCHVCMLALSFSCLCVCVCVCVCVLEKKCVCLCVSAYVSHTYGSVPIHAKYCLPDPFQITLQSFHSLVFSVSLCFVAFVRSSTLQPPLFLHLLPPSSCRSSLPFFFSRAPKKPRTNFIFILFPSLSLVLCFRSSFCLYSIL